jgi:hypothetical protein
MLPSCCRISPELMPPAPLTTPATVLQLIQEALAQVVRIGDRHREAALRNTLADLLHAGRETELAMEQLKLAVVIFTEIGSEAGGENAEIWMLREW